MRGSNLKEFKGGVVADKSIVEIMDNTFRRMSCEQCSGLVLSFNSSILKVESNRFIDNIGYQATCIYIEGQ